MTRVINESNMRGQFYESLTPCVRTMFSQLQGKDYSVNQNISYIEFVSM